MGNRPRTGSIHIQVSIDNRYRRVSLFTRVIRNGVRGDHLVATRRLADNLPVESTGDCLQVLADAVGILQQHPVIAWSVRTPESPTGDYRGLHLDHFHARWGAGVCAT